MAKKYTEFERKRIPIAKRKCDRIHNLKAFPENLIDAHYGI